MHTPRVQSQVARSFILVVDRRESVRATVSETLGRDGFRVLAVADPMAALAAMRGEDGAERPALAIIDVAGRPGDGLALLADIRHLDEAIPVILLAARDQDLDPAEGLELGADDFLVQPCSSRELLARVNGLLRRVHRTAPPPGASLGGRPGAAPSGAPGSLTGLRANGAAPILIGVPREPLISPGPGGAPAGRTAERGRFGPLVIDRAAREVHVDGQVIPTTRREFDLLSCLASAPRRVFTREQLLRSAWGSSSEWQVPATVTEHVRRLRLKLEADPARPRWLQTVRGVGYRFMP